jgi:hypothetical protein
MAVGTQSNSTLILNKEIWLTVHLILILHITTQLIAVIIGPIVLRDWYACEKICVLNIFFR